MKKTYYALKNNSGSEGTYYLDGKYLTLYPGQEINLEKAPVNKTSNLRLSIFKIEVGPHEILRKKPVKQQAEIKKPEEGKKAETPKKSEETKPAQLESLL